MTTDISLLPEGDIADLLDPRSGHLYNLLVKDGAAELHAVAFDGSIVTLGYFVAVYARLIQSYARLGPIDPVHHDGVQDIVFGAAR